MRKQLVPLLCLWIGTWGSWAAEKVLDFPLLDVNPASNRKAGEVSPRDYLLQVSGYYFGAAG